MPRIVKSNIVEIRLPSSTDDDPAIVFMNVELSTGQALDVSDAEKETVGMLNLLTECITSWNFTNDDGTPAEITVENVRHLLPKDFEALSEKLSEGVDAALDTEKKIGKDEKKA